MTLETVRRICRSFPGVTEDVKWGNDLVFSVGGKMFAAMDLQPPHSLGFKCTPEEFGALVEREGIIPAPYLARAMWVQEEALGEALDNANWNNCSSRPTISSSRNCRRRDALAPSGPSRRQSEARANDDEHGQFSQAFRQYSRTHAPRREMHPRRPDRVGTA